MSHPVYLSHPVKSFSGTKDPLTLLLERALVSLLEGGAPGFESVLIVAAHPLELGGVSGEELARSGAAFLAGRGRAIPVEFFTNPSVFVPEAHLAASAAGAALIHEAARRVHVGDCRSIAVVALEQMRATDRDTTTQALRSLIHPEEQKYGLTMPALGALLERCLAVEFPGLEEALQVITFQNRALAVPNPRAHIRKRMSRAEARSDEKNPFVADPLRLWNVAPTSSGYAALVLSRDPDPTCPVQVGIAGIGSGLDRLAISRRASLRSSAATRQAVAEICEGLGIGPEELAALPSYAEVHDAFPIIEFLGLLDLGLVPSGDPVRAIRRGEYGPRGTLPVNLSGGVMGGHPVGATGVGQIVELVLQARGVAEMSLPRGYPHFALAFNVGGPLTYNCVTLLCATEAPGQAGPFRLSTREPFRRTDVDAAFPEALTAGRLARVASFTDLRYPPPGYPTPVRIVLVEDDGALDFAVPVNGEPLACGHMVRLGRDGERFVAVPE